MSDMVQQPVIQLVQELTMTAVVERHDCTDTKKRKEKSRSPRPSLNANNTFSHPSLPSLKNKKINHFTDTTEAAKGGYPQTRPHQGTGDLSLLNVAKEHDPAFWGEPLAISGLEEGGREGLLVVHSNWANSAGHHAIYKVVLRYQWDMLALEGHNLHI